MASSFESPAALRLSRLEGPATLREAAVARLREAIVAGQIAPGALLKDAELSTQLGLSATPVREAVMQLAAEGLVEIEPNRLKRVAPMDHQAMVDLLEVQDKLWALGYALGAPKIGPADLERLRAAFADHSRAIADNDVAAAVAAAHAFHLVFMQASGNLELVRVSTDRLALIRRFVLLCAPWMASAAALEEHRGILEAAERGDAAGVIGFYEQASAILVDVARALRDGVTLKQAATA